MINSQENTAPDHCQNCNKPLLEDEHYCANCGQKALPEKLTLKYFIQEFLSNYFSFDSKFFNTVIPLLFNPAFLSKEFTDGRRIRYINPIQLFVFSSFLFFLVKSFIILKEDPDADFFKINENNKSIQNLDSIQIEETDSLYIFRRGEEADTIDQTYVGESIKRVKDFNSMDKSTQNERLSRSFSYAVFLLTPLFALYLGLLFRKRGRHYLENIIFSLHFHAFYFVLGAFILLFDRLLTGDIDTLILLVLVIIYLFVALKRFYNFSWISTIFRFIGLLFLYGITVSIVLISSILLTLFVT